MPNAIFAALLGLCRALSWPLGTLHAVLSCAGIVRLPRAVALSGATPEAALRQCWFTKLAREVLPWVLSSPLRAGAFARIGFEARGFPPQGCVVATLHSPWTRLLSQWAADQSIALVLVRHGWSRDLRGAAVDANNRGLRRMLKHLRRGGIVVVAIDAFPEHGGCAVAFLGEPRRAPTLAARLARKAAVPLVAMVPTWQDDQLRLVAAPPVMVREGCDEAAATRRAIAFIDRCVREDPARWNESVRRGVGLRSQPCREEAAVHADRLPRHEGGGG